MLKREGGLLSEEEIEVLDQQELGIGEPPRPALAGYHDSGYADRMTLDVEDDLHEHGDDGRRPV